MRGVPLRRSVTRCRVSLQRIGSYAAPRCRSRTLAAGRRDAGNSRRGIDPWCVVRCGSYAALMAKRPSRIDLLELDIDLRLADLWREATEITDWNLEVMAAFIRAAYGKGYCDALTEDAPGSLCHDHGYRIPDRRPAPTREA
jgi:hypothetical protein